MPTSDQTTRIVVSLDKADHQRLKAAAKFFGMSMSAYVRQSFLKELARTENQWGNHYRVEKKSDDLKHQRKKAKRKKKKKR